MKVWKQENILLISSYLNIVEYKSISYLKISTYTVVVI